MSKKVEKRGLSNIKVCVGAIVQGLEEYTKIDQWNKKIIAANNSNIN